MPKPSKLQPPSHVLNTCHKTKPVRPALGTSPQTAAAEATQNIECKKIVHDRFERKQEDLI